MISVDVEFQSGVLNKVLARLLSLPLSLRPTQFGDDETDKRRRTSIDDHEAFLKFFDNRTTGFFLFGKTSHYFGSIASRKSIKIHGWVERDPGLARHFLVHMASAQPIFGYACEGEERNRWNRIKTKQGINSIESWVGRNPQKYVPGLYWWTLLPTATAERHHVSLAALEDVALEHIELEGGQNLFRFYEKPDEWRSAAAVDTLRASQPGIFDVEKVRPVALAAKTFLELSAVIRPWR